MIFEENDLAGIIMFFSGKSEIVREMSYTEFQAILDGYVPAVDLANRELHAVYVEINSDYKAKNVVFFLLEFSSSGFVDSSWSLPLLQLARHAAKGPNLGAGPIGLACASHCPIKHHAESLWDPDLRSGKGEFTAIARAVARNKVAIHFREGDPEAKRKVREAAENQAVMEQSITRRVRNEYDKELRDHLAQAIKEQCLRTTTMVNEREAAIQCLKREHAERLDGYRMMLDEKVLQITDEHARNETLKETISGQAEKIRGLREYFELKLEQAEVAESDQIKYLKENYECEIEASIAAATVELNELLQMRAVELLFRNEQEGKLHDESTKLRADNKALTENSGDHLLTKMLEKGISFVTYQPGAGHITVPVSEISFYMENPMAYVAEKCGVKEAHYSAWIEHFHVPICRAEDAGGSMCGENIHRVEAPVDFIVGEADCCHKHGKVKVPKLKITGTF
ncbi:MAG: hypothetical protein ACI9Y1_000829 [Lentisphaeria bacterium]